MLANSLLVAKENLKPTETIERTLFPKVAPTPTEKRWTKTADGWIEVDVALPGASDRPATLQGTPHEAHGQCFGFECERNGWVMPQRTFATENAARPGYDTVDASEYSDTADVLEAKLQHLARLMQRSKCTVVYAGAGLSTAAGIDDYATHNKATSDADERLRSPMCAQPTSAHRVLVGLHRAGHLHRLIQQNHDGLPQKAGMPQEALNEIHGSLYAPDNPVIPMSGNLRPDLLDDLLDCEQRADLVVAVGTSLAGMNADRVVHTASARAARRQRLGTVIIGLQRTTADADATLRLFATCDQVFGRLADILGEATTTQVPEAPPRGTFFRPPVLQQAAAAAAAGAGVDDDDEGGYSLPRVRYDAMGRRCDDEARSSPGDRGGLRDLDLRLEASVVIPSGLHAGACGEVVGLDREGHLRCRFHLRLKPGPLQCKRSSIKAPMTMALGCWWLQAAADATVPQLPVVNLPDENDASEAAQDLRALVAEY